MTLRVDDLDVAGAKIAGYLLAPEHPDGRGKALFFGRVGFSRSRPDALADALREHAAAHDARVEPSPFGERIVVDGTLAVPNGRSVSVRAVWFRESGSSRIRLVTAYPIRP